MADSYREAGDFWSDVRLYLLPEFVPLLSQARDAIDRKAELFIEGGAANLDEIIEERDRLQQLVKGSGHQYRLNEEDFAGGLPYPARQTDVGGALRVGRGGGAERGGGSHRVVPPNPNPKL